MVTHLQISTNNTRRARREHRWKQLAPTVLWSILILVLTPSLRGFSLSGVYVGNRIGLARGMSFPRSDIRREVVASSEACSGAEVARRSPLAAESWLRRRFRAERRRIKMQVASWTQGAVDPEVVASGPIPSSERVFLIDGWRWHTRVAIRDSGRFRKVALFAAKKSTGMDETMDMDSRGMGRVVKSYQHMWDFSFAKLFMIETKLFFPWLRKLLPREVLPLLSQFEKEREDIIRIGRQIGTSLDEAVRNSEARRSPRAALLRCADLSSLLETKVSSLSRTQEDSIIPITSAHVSSKDQDRFNDKVIRSLGLLDAQVLLVAMHDTLKPDRQEYGLFRSQVPKVARALIPTWRRLLYRPRAGCLEESDELSVL